MAFGGVLIGRHIAEEAAIATPISTIAEPPPLSVSPMPVQTVARIGTSSAAVAVLEITYKA